MKLNEKTARKWLQEGGHIYRWSQGAAGHRFYRSNGDRYYVSFKVFQKLLPDLETIEPFTSRVGETMKLKED